MRRRPGGGGYARRRLWWRGNTASGPSAPSGPSSPSAPSGPDDTLSGSSANDVDKQSELLDDLSASLANDGLETVTPENVESTLEAFK